MHLGSQMSYSEENLAFAAQMGVEWVDTSPSAGLGLEEDGFWHADALKRVRERVESYGLTLAAMHLPLTSAGIDRQIWPNVMMGTDQRDRDIEQIIRCIQAASEAGIPRLLYNLAILPVVRTSYRSLGRGGVTYSHFKYDDVKDNPLLPYAPITADQAWERITYFVEQVIPVATEYGVMMGCHQHDPGMPPGQSYRGVDRVLGSLEGVKRFISLSDSPYHGLNFCQGTISEMCTSPEQVYEAIEYFGQRKRIFWVHFRNIRGGLGDFEEVYPDEGDINMLQAMRVYKKVGYDSALVPDHVPHSAIDGRYGYRSRAYCLGYIRGLLQTVAEES